MKSLKYKILRYIVILCIMFGYPIGSGLNFITGGDKVSSLADRVSYTPKTASSYLFYNASWTCFDVAVGSVPANWTDYEAGHGTVEVIRDYNGHYHPIKLSDDSTSGYAGYYRNFSASQTSGIIEYWLYFPSNPVCGYFAARDGNTIAFSLHQAYSTWRACEIDTGISITTNKWIHVQISFTPGLVTFRADGSQIAQLGWMNGLSKTDNILISSGATVETGSTYYDAIGLSWTGYQAGDNKHGIDLNQLDFPEVVLIPLIVVSIVLVAGILIFYLIRHENLQDSPKNAPISPQKRRVNNTPIINTSRDQPQISSGLQSPRSSPEIREEVPILQEQEYPVLSICPYCGMKFSPEQINLYKSAKTFKCNWCSSDIVKGE